MINLFVFCEIKQENYLINNFFLNVGLVYIFMYFLFGIILF